MCRRYLGRRSRPRTLSGCGDQVAIAGDEFCRVVVFLARFAVLLGYAIVFALIGRLTTLRHDIT